MWRPEAVSLPRSADKLRDAHSAAGGTLRVADARALSAQALDVNIIVYQPDMPACSLPRPALARALCTRPARALGPSLHVQATQGALSAWSLVPDRKSHG